MDLQVHGVLNAVSWGTLMPMGALIARYLKVFQSADPAWFYLHVSCQASAYAVGVAGWATGLKLGSESSANNKVHGNIGLALFVLGTLQVRSEVASRMAKSDDFTNQNLSMHVNSDMISRMTIWSWLCVCRDSPCF